MNLQRFLRQNCFFNESVCFLVSETALCLFSHEFHMNLQGFFKIGIVFSTKVFVFLFSGIL